MQLSIQARLLLKTWQQIRLIGAAQYRNSSINSRCMKYRLMGKASQRAWYWACLRTRIFEIFGPDDSQAMHLMFEAMKLAFRDSAAYIADPAYMTHVAARHLLDSDYLAERARLIDPAKAQDFRSGAPRQGGTVCLSAADSNGMMVSFIQSNFAGFGSGVVVPDTGIHLQNRGCGFCLDEGHPNQLGGGKRPFHTIIPGFLMGENDPIMAFVSWVA